MNIFLSNKSETQNIQLLNNIIRYVSVINMFQREFGVPSYGV